MVFASLLLKNIVLISSEIWRIQLPGMDQQEDDLIGVD